jgi:tRNA acetyltransferase TAN1
MGNGLEQLCEIVLKPVFGDSTVAKKAGEPKLHQHSYCIADIEKFAIRPTIRNNDILNRDVVIKTVADAVGRLGSSHSVNLTDYDCLILVEVYRVSYLS